jgi:hypothetical protein
VCLPHHLINLQAISAGFSISVWSACLMISLDTGEQETDAMRAARIMMRLIFMVICCATMSCYVLCRAACIVNISLSNDPNTKSEMKPGFIIIILWLDKGMFARGKNRVGILNLFYRENLLSRNLSGNRDQPVRNINGRIKKTLEDNKEAAIGYVSILRSVLTVQRLLKDLY